MTPLIRSPRYDSFGQFVKFFPSYSRSIDMEKTFMQQMVASTLLYETALMEKGHWAYDINRHQALYELRDALREEIAAIEKPSLPSCNGHERIHEDGSGDICRHCGIDMDDDDGAYDDDDDSDFQCDQRREAAG